MSEPPDRAGSTIGDLDSWCSGVLHQLVNEWEKARREGHALSNAQGSLLANLQGLSRLHEQYLRARQSVFAKFDESVRASSRLSEKVSEFSGKLTGSAGQSSGDTGSINEIKESISAINSKLEKLGKRPGEGTEEQESTTTTTALLDNSTAVVKVMQQILEIGQKVSGNSSEVVTATKELQSKLSETQRSITDELKKHVEELIDAHNTAVLAKLDSSNTTTKDHADSIKQELTSTMDSHKDTMLEKMEEYSKASSTDSDKIKNEIIDAMNTHKQVILDTIKDVDDNTSADVETAKTEITQLMASHQADLLEQIGEHRSGSLHDHIKKSHKKISERLDTINNEAVIKLNDNGSVLQKIYELIGPSKELETNTNPSTSEESPDSSDIGNDDLPQTMMGFFKEILLSVGVDPNQSLHGKISGVSDVIGQTTPGDNGSVVTVHDRFDKVIATIEAVSGAILVKPGTGDQPTLQSIAADEKAIQATVNALQGVLGTFADPDPGATSSTAASASSQQTIVDTLQELQARIGFNPVYTITGLLVFLQRTIGDAGDRDSVVAMLKNIASAIGWRPNIHTTISNVVQDTFTLLTTLSHSLGHQSLGTSPRRLTRTPPTFTTFAELLQHLQAQLGHCLQSIDQRS